jgi:hypothetical protein
MSVSAQLSDLFVCENVHIFCVEIERFRHFQSALAHADMRTPHIKTTQACSHTLVLHRGGGCFENYML